ncbi:MAG: hypothetical protein H6502_00560 [Candidatus Woesearchaeota archaeon]|nr:MAG: hypothetical protein H6502_00560 [Candidatus Woesearchaeota archaeon]
MKFNKRGQAALEFLTTYGWAFLVILVMIGALAYFGVLSPDRFASERCNFGTEIACDKDTSLLTAQETNTVQIMLSNKMGKEIDLLNFRLKPADAAFAECFGLPDMQAATPATNTYAAAVNAYFSAGTSNANVYGGFWTGVPATDVYECSGFLDPANICCNDDGDSDCTSGPDTIASWTSRAANLPDEILAQDNGTGVFYCPGTYFCDVGNTGTALGTATAFAPATGCTDTAATAGGVCSKVMMENDNGIFTMHCPGTSAATNTNMEVGRKKAVEAELTYHTGDANYAKSIAGDLYLTVN